MTVNEDAQLSWNYSSAWADQTVSGGGCAVAGSAGVPRSPGSRRSGDSPDVAARRPSEPSTPAVHPCETTPAPPVGVPTADEAEAAHARPDDRGRRSIPPTFKLEPYADEWFASVDAIEQLDGQFNGRRFSTGFGAEGVLQYAGGQLAEPAPVGPYPLVDLDTAIARLNDPFGLLHGRLRRRHRPRHGRRP